jgi:hypothetical protein
VRFMKTYGLTEFLAMARDFKKIQSLIFKGMIALPLAGIWLKLGPPTNNSTAILLTITELLVLVLTFQLWYPLTPSRLKARFVVSACLCLAAIIGLVCFLNFYTLQIGDGRIVIGTRLQDAVGRVLGPGYTTMDALKDSEYDPEKVWTPTSVRAVTTLLELNWLLAVITYTAGLAAFAMLLRTHLARKRPNKTHSTDANLVHPGD